MRTIKGVVLLALLWVSSAGATGIDTDLQNQFNVMANVTHPGAYSTTTRGVLDGGSVYLRNPVKTIHPITVTPPSISAGCHGIDLRAGSLSFISASQFIDALRAIAADAPSYAFSQALAGMCPQCFQIIKDLQNDLQHINSLSLNSCRTAEALVNAPFGQQGLEGFVQNSSYSASAQQAAQQGGSSDFFSQALDSTQSFLDGTSNIFGSNNGAAANKTGHIGNATQRAVSETQPQFNLSSFDPNFANYVMSMIGTTVIWPVAGSGLPQSNSFPATLRLPDLVDGNPNVTIFNCPDFTGVNDTIMADGNTTAPDNTHDCLDANGNPLTSVVSIKGLYEEIVPLLTSDPNVLLDPADATSTPGVLEVWNNPGLCTSAPCPSAQQQNLVSALPGNMGAALYRLNKVNPGGAKIFAQDVARAAATYFAYSYVKNVIDSMLTSSNASLTWIAQQSLPLAHDALDHLEKDNQELIARSSATNHLAQEYDALISLRDPSRSTPMSILPTSVASGSH